MSLGDNLSFEFPFKAHQLVGEDGKVDPTKQKLNNDSLEEYLAELEARVSALEP